MSGSRNGVATQIMREEKRAVYTHCYGHSLNLAVGDTIKRSKVCREALETAFEITKLIKFLPRGMLLSIGSRHKVLTKTPAVVSVLGNSAIPGQNHHEQSTSGGLFVVILLTVSLRTTTS